MAVTAGQLMKRDRLRVLHQWHVEWSAKWRSRAVFDAEYQRQHPGSDYNLHYLDVDPPGDSGDEYQEMAHRIMRGPWPPVDPDVAALRARTPRTAGATA